MSYPYLLIAVGIPLYALGPMGLTNVNRHARRMLLRLFCLCDFFSPLSPRSVVLTLEHVMMIVEERVGRENFEKLSDHEKVASHLFVVTAGIQRIFFLFPLEDHQKKKRGSKHSVHFQNGYHVLFK